MGRAAYGQLGRGEPLSSSGDVLAVLGLGPEGSGSAVSSVSSASCGFDHTGIVTCEGQLLLCGKNNKGQCARKSRGTRGDKDPPDFSEDLAVPQVPEGLLAGSKVKQVACGGEHTLVLMETGEVLSCGSNLGGQLGLGQSGPKMSASLSRVKLPPADAVSAGFCHSAAICSDRLYMWGDCNQGQLGLGRRQRQMAEPQLVDVGGPVRAVALGRWHSLVLSLGTVWAFGWGRFGVLAQGQNMENHLFPVKIEGLPAPVHILACGAVHCGAVCGPARECYMWGRGSLGRLGLELGSEANVARPRPVPGLRDVTALALGGDFSAAVTAAGDWWLWGKNEEGQLGQGDMNRENAWKPIRTPALAGYRQAALGDCHALAFR